MAKVPGLNTWLNRSTKQFVTQVSSGGMEERFPAQSFHGADGEPASNANWIHAPDLSAVTGQPAKYWVITGDTVTLMDAAARAAVDAAEVESRKDAAIAQVNAKDIMFAAVLTLLDEINKDRPGNQRITVDEFKALVRAKL